MVISKRVGLLVALPLLACAPKVSKYELSIVTTGCASANPFQGVQFLRIRVFGDGIGVPLEVIEPAANKSAELPEIPAGTNRVIEVRAYDKEPAAGGRVVSIGRTLPFVVPDKEVHPEGSPELLKSVVLRQVNTWVQAVSITERERCQTMRVARAGHTATLLANGKVFIAGGFNYPPANPNRLALMQTEIFDPSTGTFTAADDLSFRTRDMVVNKVAKAFHTATRTKNGQVLLWGGETYQLLNGVNVVAPRSEVLSYDPDTNTHFATQRNAPPPIPRTQHQAVMDSGGRVLIVGGLRFNTSGSGPRLVPVNELEWFDPNEPIPRIVEGLQARRVEASVAAVKGGEFIAVAGGTDGTALRDDVVFYGWNGTTFAQQMQTNPPRLAAPGRRGAAAVSFKGGADMLVLGGYSDVATLKPVQSVEVVQSQVTTVARGSDVGDRGEICAVTLTDGSVLAIGGRTADQNGMMVRSDNRVTIVRSSESGGTTSESGPSLTIGRYLHTCTLLGDGSVLVTGGVNETPMNTTGEVLADAWIFTPPPPRD